MCEHPAEPGALVGKRPVLYEIIDDHVKDRVVSRRNRSAHTGIAAFRRPLQREVSRIIEKVIA
jgi:hypothetical protein